MGSLSSSLFSCILLFSLVASSSQSVFNTQSLAESASPCGPKDPSNATTTANAKKEPYTTRFFTQSLDHYSYDPKNYHTFQQRYLVNDTHWGGKQRKAPIFVFIGHGDDIKTIAEQTGLLFDIAPTFHALTVFIEHRYFGQSLPFGNATKVFKDQHKLGYLSSSQALGDVATLITDLKQNLSSEDSPVVVFGSSYGGNLAAWFRLKYPHIAIGALASSAPLLFFRDLNISPYKFTDIITEDYRSVSKNCYNTIRSWWDATKELASTEAGKNKLIESLKICENVDKSLLLIAIHTFLEFELTIAAIADYPTPTPPFVPAYPVETICHAVDKHEFGTDPISTLYSAMNAFYNSTGKEKCLLDLSPSGDEELDPNSDGWHWQACTELVEPQLKNNNESVFPYEFNHNILGCYGTYQVEPRANWIPTEFGGHNIKKVLKKFASNIIFYSSLKDPLSAGSVTKSISKSIVALAEKEGAHTQDLMPSSKQDPKWLQIVRKKEVRIIERWLQQYYIDLRTA